MILIWSVALASLLLSTRLAAAPTAATLGLATALTALLLAVPRHPAGARVRDQDSEPDAPVRTQHNTMLCSLHRVMLQIITDGMFILRTVMVVFTAASAILGTAATALDYGMHEVKPAPVKKLL